MVGATGALTEAPSSPFGAGAVTPNMPPSKPLSMATEPSGHFLYVGYASGDSSTTSAVVPFSIDAANLKLVLTPQLSLDFTNAAPIQMLSDPKGLRLYVGLGAGLNQAAPAAGETGFVKPAKTGGGGQRGKNGARLG